MLAKVGRLYYTMTDSEIYLSQLRLEDEFTKRPSTYELAQAFKENRNEVMSIRAILVKELDVYKPWLRKHPFNINFMKIDPRTLAINEIDKFLNFTKSLLDSGAPDNAGRITQSDIERAKLVPIESLFSFKRKGKRVSCPLHDDNDPSASIKDNKLRCFVCNTTLDTIELTRKIHGLSFVEAVGRLVK